MTHAAADPEAHAWLRAAADPRVAQGLLTIHDTMAREIERRGPACWASGRCCNFDRAGHRLYVTGLEAAYALTHQPITTHDIARANADGGCPYQLANLCTARDVRPVGCRAYFCDRATFPWQAELSEAALRALRAIHDENHIPYAYAEWRAMLSRVRAALEPT